MSKTQWVVTVADEHLAQLDAVVEDLKAAGLCIGRVLGTLGQVTGHTEAATSSQASFQQSFISVQGVISADIQETYSVNPPDSDVQ